MATFQYEAMNSVGQPVKGEVDATSSEEAIAKVRAMGNFPTKIKEKAGGKRSQGGASAGGGGGGGGGGRGMKQAGRVSQKLLTQFTRQLSTLINAGLPILRSLRILEQQQKPGMMRVAVRLVAEDVEGGSSLTEALARHPKTFDRLYMNMVHAGEVGGVLDVVLNRLADFMEQSMALKRKVVGAMIYPIAVITFAILIVVGLLYFVVPSFKEVFKDEGADLPAITQSLLDISAWVQSGGWAIILGSPVLVFLIFKLMRMSEGGRHIVDSMKLHVPLLGSIVNKTSVARFSRTLGTLLHAGVPILDALNITRETAGNAVFSQAMVKVHDGIREGESFAQPLRQAKIVDPMVVNMIDVGEETGELDQMLEKVADTYEDEVEVLVSSMTSLLEPVLIIVLGVIVGFIVVALFMPMVKLLQQMS
ncbi:MAG: type II secretion system F family protein [Phycisphaerae bacterium]